MKKIISILLLILTGQFLFAREILPNFPEIPPSVLQIAKIDFDDGLDPMNSRLFCTTKIRTQINLEGFWDFVLDPDDKGESDKYFIEFPEPETRLWVPGTWNAVGRYWQYQGPAWFERTVDVPAAGNLRIRFGGVFYTARIWFDGKYIGEHEGGYSPFAFLIQDATRGKHKLTVRIDNTLDDESLPKDGVDWFPYGGMFRPVYAELVSDVYIDKFHIIPSDISSEKTRLLVRIFTNNISDAVVSKEVKFEVNGKVLYTGSHMIDNGRGVAEFTAQLENSVLWSPENPYLYSAHVILGSEEDDQFDRFGIRSLIAEGYKIILNGKRVKLMGANHHDDHPDWGSALPPHIIKYDIEILKRMGANAVRGHYPPCEMFMDFCDRNGLFFMNEVPSWQYRPEQLAKKVVKEKIKNQYYDMVYRDMNRPSILCWSLGNEWREFHKSSKDIKELIDYARTVDKTHFITFISGGAHTTDVTKLLDIICTNWAKYQWYWNPTLGKSTREITSTVLDEELGRVSIKKLDKIHENYPDKPVICTEFGGSGSQAGWHNWGNVKWSEEYQARNVWDSGKYALEQDWLSGGCVWQFCDTRTTHYRMLGPRLRGWNVKGVVDCYRAPKMSFYKLQELFHMFSEKIF
jgi:beta-glucuronidase